MAELPPESTATPGAVAFVEPDPAWSRYDQPSMRVLLVLLEQTLRTGARELMVVTAGQHHATVFIVPDREPLEIAQLELKYYAGMRDFLNKGLFASGRTPRIQALGSQWALALEQESRPGGEGFTLTLKPYLLGVS